jgi:proteic killer suppression protein
VSIKTFASKGVEEVFYTGRSRRIGAEFRKRMILILDALNAATCVEDLHNARGFHALTGDRSGSFAMSVSGNWRLTFRFDQGDKGDVVDVDFETTTDSTTCWQAGA